jgi:NAD(P)-dependent dehydrogenase (short-subunit alcohol dehydrogenase family)
MKSELRGKHILFIGGCGGIGSVASRSLLQEGANLSITTLPDNPNNNAKRSFFEKTVKESQSSAKFQIIETDITIDEHLRRLINTAEETLGIIDHLVITAGVSHLGKLLDVSREEWDLVFDTNVWGVLHSIQEITPHLKKGAKIVVIGSDVGLGKPSHDIPLYSISKGALHSIIMLLAQELPERGISICGIAPYNTPPGMSKVYRKKDGRLLCEAENCNTPDWGNLPPTGRFIDVETLARTIVFLLQASEDFNGTIIPITGGYGLTVS